MRHYVVFQRGAQDRKAVNDSGYAWDAVVFAPSWAFRNGLHFHGLVLMASYAGCAFLMGVMNHGFVVGGALALWLGVFSAHNANDWLASSYERRGYHKAGGVEADSSEDALRAAADGRTGQWLPQPAASR